MQLARRMRVFEVSNARRVRRELGLSYSAEDLGCDPISFCFDKPMIPLSDF